MSLHGTELSEVYSESPTYDETDASSYTRVLLPQTGEYTSFTASNGWVFSFTKNERAVSHDRSYIY